MKYKNNTFVCSLVGTLAEPFSSKIINNFIAGATLN